jgi:hypothetical protein
VTGSERPPGSWEEEWGERYELAAEPPPREPREPTGDAVLDAMGGDWSELGFAGLVRYYRERFARALGYPYPLAGDPAGARTQENREGSVMRAFERRWGEEAGPILRWFFERHGGRWEGTPAMIPRLCSAGSKWIQDRLYMEMMDARRPAEAGQGAYLGAEEFLGR